LYLYKEGKMANRVRTYEMLINASAPAKSPVLEFQSVIPISIDVIITGSPVVNLYVSNIESNPNGTRWGSPIKSFSSSTKLIIENEPWKYWMVEYASGTGTANVVFGT